MLAALGSKISFHASLSILAMYLGFDIVRIAAIDVISGFNGFVNVYFASEVNFDMSFFEKSR